MSGSSQALSVASTSSVPYQQFPASNDHASNLQSTVKKCMACEKKFEKNQRIRYHGNFQHPIHDIICLKRRCGLFQNTKVCAICDENLDDYPSMSYEEAFLKSTFNLNPQSDNLEMELKFLQISALRDNADKISNLGSAVILSSGIIFFGLLLIRISIT